jgi:hypothetical protein
MIMRVCDACIFPIGWKHEKREMIFRTLSLTLSIRVIRS